MDKQELLSLWGGDPITREVLTSNPEEHAPSVPRYLVRAALLDIPFQRDYHKFKLVGLAQSHVLCNPASLRPSPLLTSLEPPPPELIFNETGPYSDVWLAAKTIYKLFVGDVGSGETSPRWIYDAGQASSFYGQWQGRLAQLRTGFGEDAVLAEELGERMAERKMASGSIRDFVEALVPALRRILEGMLLAEGSERTSLVDARDEIEALMAVVGTWSLST
ncbi:hypothetical protein BDZ85DRAFT_81081 [Elsinoe ampelina]|uniref:Uncharacterized protein n=1 Tax=Elsinoe ampelina TaxID=302913 RepID=A0A6A6FYN2_9PEZI|nr:hypothetical protein BDZ85DRAFT_81081 [Elsinoe ampelina]